MMRKIERDNSGRMQAGQDLVVAGYVGQAGAAEILRSQRQMLLQWFSAEYLDMMEEQKDLPCGRGLAYWEPFGATECEPVGAGGILTAIWNLSGAYETGVEFSLRRIPIRQETIELCEQFELNPYRLYSSGCYLLTAANGGQLVQRLEAEQIPARVIGTVNPGIAREMIIDGGRGFLERPQPDELLKVIPDFQCNCSGRREYR